MLRFHGSRDKVTFELVGTNSGWTHPGRRPPRLSAALTGWNASRRGAAARYADLGLGDLVELPADGAGHVYHLYVVCTPRRDEVAATLNAEGIAATPYYTTPLHLQPALDTSAGRPARSRRRSVAAENLALPMWGGIGCGGAGARRRRRPPSAFPYSHAVANHHRLCRSSSTASSSPSPGCSRGTCASTGTRAARSLRPLPRVGRRPARRRDHAPVFVAFGLQPLVALRLDTRHVERLRGVVVAVVVAFLVFTLLDFHPASVPRGIWFVDTLLLLASSPALASSPDAHRAAVGGRDRRARQGGRQSEPGTQPS